MEGIILTLCKNNLYDVIDFILTIHQLKNLNSFFTKFVIFCILHIWSFHITNIQTHDKSTLVINQYGIDCDRSKEKLFYITVIIRLIWIYVWVWIRALVIYKNSYAFIWAILRRKKNREKFTDVCVKQNHWICLYFRSTVLEANSKSHG